MSYCFYKSQGRSNKEAFVSAYIWNEINQFELDVLVAISYEKGGMASARFPIKGPSFNSIIRSRDFGDKKLIKS